MPKAYITLLWFIFEKNESSLNTGFTMAGPLISRNTAPKKSAPVSIQNKPVTASISACRWPNP
jgi:hypothetical protein